MSVKRKSLGTKFEPGNDETHFCKPSSVVVSGEDFIFVGDGYCNSRVVKFNMKGKFVAEFGKMSEKLGVPGGMNLVHDLTISHTDRIIFVADRENGQVRFAGLLSSGYNVSIFVILL